MLYINIHGSVVKKNSSCLNADFVGIQRECLVFAAGIDFESLGTSSLCLEAFNFNCFRNGIHVFFNILNLCPACDSEKVVQCKFYGTTTFLCAVDIKAPRKHLYLCICRFKGCTQVVYQLLFKSLYVASLEGKFTNLSKVCFCINRKIYLFLYPVFHFNTLWKPQY